MQQSPEDVTEHQAVLLDLLQPLLRLCLSPCPNPPCSEHGGVLGVQKGDRRNKSTPNWLPSAFPPASWECKLQSLLGGLVPTQKMTSKSNAIEGGARGRSGTGPLTSPPPR